MINRRMFLASGISLPLASAVARAEQTPVRTVDKSFALNGNNLRIPWPALTRPVRFIVAGDTHFAFHDPRDDAYADNYARMAKWPGRKEPFERMLARARQEKVDALVLVGDNISFPTRANVDYLKSALDGCGVPWLYVAGNHDWHFEGVPGSDIEQRAKWTAERLTPLYQGANPLMASRLINGVRFVMIDNSVYHVLPEQLEFYRAEAAKGDPLCLFMHIPLYVSEGDSICTCAHPKWGAAVDPYWQIERRERWAERAQPSTFAFRDAVLATENLVGVFVGHHHELQVHRAAGQNLFTVPGNQKGLCLDVRLEQAMDLPKRFVSGKTGDRQLPAVNRQY